MLEVINPICKPTRGSKYSACIDLRASEDIELHAGEIKVIGLGVKLNEDLMREATANADFEWWKSNHYLQLMLRSSLGKKGLILPNGIGIIDSDYRDEIKMIIQNQVGCLYQTEPSDGRYTIRKGDRIGQIMICRHETDLFGIKSEEERDGGLGSTGVR